MAAGEPVINVTDLIDDRPLSALQIRTIVLCGLVALLDGVDTQAIGIAAPAISQALQTPISSFGAIFAAGLLGATTGALFLGSLGDRFGRKRVLIVATIIFASFTLATAFVNSFPMLLLVRFLAGIGLGGATPCFIALTSEYSPRRMRSFLVSAEWAAFPLGGVAGGFLSSVLIPIYGWQSIFVVGTVLPLIVAVILVVALPESVRFLVTNNADPAEVNRIVRQIDPMISPTENRFVVHHHTITGAPVKHLFMEGRALGTILIWIPFFMSFMILIYVPLWAPALLRETGMSVSLAAFIVAFNNLGAVAGMSSVGYLLDRYSAIPLLITTFILGALATGTLGFVASSFPTLALASFVSGLFVGAGGAGVIVVAANAYPTAIRSTGLGWAMGMARLGQVVGPFIGGLMLAAGWGADRIFMSVAVPALLAALAIALLGTFAQSMTADLVKRKGAALAH